MVGESNELHGYQDILLRDAVWHLLSEGHAQVGHLLQRLLQLLGSSTYSSAIATKQPFAKFLTTKKPQLFVIRTEVFVRSALGNLHEVVARLAQLVHVAVHHRLQVLHRQTGHWA